MFSHNFALTSLNLFLLATLLIQQTQLTLGQVPTRVYIALDDTAFAGKIIGQYSGGIEECKAQCDNTPKCSAFNYDNNFNCYLKSDSGQMNKKVGTIAYVIDMVELFPEKQNQAYLCYQDIESFGEVYRSYLGITQDECQQNCNRFSSCAMYIWRPTSTADKPYCALKTESLSSYYTTNGYQSKFCMADRFRPQPRNYRLERNIAYYGSDILNYTGPVQDCPYLCDRTPGCVGFDFSYSLNQMYCTLKSSTSEKHTVFGSNGYVLDGERIAFATVGKPRAYAAAKDTYAGRSNILRTLLKTTDFETCSQECDSVSGCQIISIYKGDCHLISSTNYVGNSVGNDSYITLTPQSPRVFTGTLPSGQPLYKNEKLRSPNGINTLHIQFDGKTHISMNSISVYIFPKPLNYLVAHGVLGLLTLRTFDYRVQNVGIDSSCTGCTFSLILTDTLILKVIKNSDGSTAGFSSEFSYDQLPSIPSIKSLDDQYWAHQLIFGKSVLDKSSINSTWGKDTRIYFIDSGVTSEFDSANTFSNYTNEDYIEGPYLSGISSVPGDMYRHGTSLVTMIKSNITGLAQSATAVSVKITEWETKYFTERSFVEAVAWIYSDVVPSSTTKIINFSGSFDGGSSDVVKCAIQWAFYNNIVFISAAGNENLLVDKTNPYELVVGSFNKPGTNGKSSIWSESNYGPAIDIWAPNSFISPNRIGTSFATGYVSAAAAIAISRWPLQLKNNVASVYKYLIDYGNTVTIDAATTNFKAKSSSNWKSLSMRSLSSKPNIISTTFSNNNCKNSQMQFDKVNPNWNALIEKASSTRWGHIVAFTNGAQCASTFSKC